MKSHGAKRKRKGSPSSRKKSWCEGCFLASNSHFPLTRPLQRMLALQQQIASFVGAVSAQRGLQYYREGKAELDTVSSHQGTRADEVDQVVRGHVAGSSFAPYQAWASVSGGTILDAHCSCPIGSKGQCKHVAALVFAAKLGPEQTGAKTQFVTVPASSNTNGQGSSSRQLWSGPFSSGKQLNTSPVSAFRSQISPKKSIWGSGLVSSPTTATAPFSVQPGFSLRDAAPHCSPKEGAEVATSPPSSPFKGKDNRTHLYPITAPLCESQVPIVQTPQLSQPEADVETAQDSQPTGKSLKSTHTSTTTTAPSLDNSLSYATLQDELSASRLYSANLEKQNSLLQDQVKLLQIQLNTLREKLAQQLQASPPSSASSTSSAMSASLQPSTSNPIQSSDHSKMEIAQPPAEELRDSIETSSDEGNINPKKRLRQYEPVQKPGLTKRLSFEITNDAPKPFVGAIASHPNHNVAASDIDSQALMDVMDQFEAIHGTSTDNKLGALVLSSNNPASVTPSCSQSQIRASHALSFDRLTQSNFNTGKLGTPPNSPSESQGSASEETAPPSKPVSPMSHSVAVITQLIDSPPTIRRRSSNPA